jgi:hypothetical protein
MMVFVTLPSAGDTADTLQPHRNFIGFNPLSLVLGGITTNYERVNGHHGFLVEGQYTFPLLGSSSYEGGLAYRYHLSKSDLGGFIGPFVKTGYLESKVHDESRNEYRYTFSYTTLGLTIGKRGDLWARYHLHYATRIGLGYPVKSNWEWSPLPPEKIGGGFDEFFENNSTGCQISRL